MHTRGWRTGAARVALLCHVFATFGLPVTTPVRDGKPSDVPYPCQSRPCACLTADECWRGDCCCFTLEQKLSWADENGVEPPAHVRPLVESRAARPALAEKRPCCSEPEPAPACCESPAPGACPHCAPPREERAAPAPAVKWVAGLFAQKCRGEGPAGLFLLVVSVAPEVPPLPIAPAPRQAHPAPHSERATSSPHVPPTPPPRTA